MQNTNNKFVARQAILDRDLNTFAYELLYRKSLENIFSASMPEQATSQVIFQNHILGDLTNLCLQKKAFINFDEVDILEQFPLMLDKNTIVVELLATINVTAEIVEAVSSLYKNGYTLALDDYNFSVKWEALLPYISIIKVDRENIAFDQIALLTKAQFVIERNIKIVVERVETDEQFQSLKEIGIDYFQGYFFHRPEVKSGFFIEPIKFNLLKLFAEVCQPFIDFNSVSEIISHDVSLMNGTLRLVNLSTESDRQEITSIKQAVTFLGTEKVKHFIGIIAMSNLSSDCANEVLKESLVRAKMMEYLSSSAAFSNIKDFAFVTGIVSHLDTILKSPLENILINLPLAKKIKAALIEKKGLLHEALEIAKYYESPDKKQSIHTLMAKHEICEEILINYYHDSLKWCISTIR